VTPLIEQSPKPAIGERVHSFLRNRFAPLKGPLSTVQTVVGLITGILSIGGALLAIPGFFAPPPNKGEVVAIVQEAKTEKAVTDATIEILTPQNAVVTMLTPNYFGKARYWVDEGQYRVRVSHPRFAAEIRQVRVVPGQTAEIRVQLRAGASSTLRQAERVIDEGVDTIRRLFGR
jgi:hypothetical protein